MGAGIPRQGEAPGSEFECSILRQLVRPVDGRLPMLYSKSPGGVNTREAKTAEVVPVTEELHASRPAMSDPESFRTTGLNHTGYKPRE